MRNSAKRGLYYYQDTIILVILPFLGVFLGFFLGCNGEKNSDEDEIETFLVEFNIGNFEGAVNPVSVEVKSGQSLGVDFPSAPVRGGFDFYGWYADGSQFTESTIVRRSVTLTAYWGAPIPAEAGSFAALRLKTPLKNYAEGNPIMTQNFGADPNVLEWEGRLYVYMTADAFFGQGDNPNNYSYIKSLQVLSTEDLINWTQHPQLKIENIGGAKSYISNLWAPAPVVKEVNGVKKIFLYFSNGGTGTGVISAEHPLGPWTSPRDNFLVSQSTPNSSVKNPFDPAVLVDDDGRAYLYYGGGTPDGGDAVNFTSRHPNPENMRVVQLTDDMINIAGTPENINLPFSFEASEINKINGKYYYSYSTNPQVNHYATRPADFPEAVIIGDSFAIAYAISDRPMGPFTFTGSFLHNPGKMFNLPYNNNHHKLFEYKGRFYVVYHTKLLMDAYNKSGDYDANVDLGLNYRATNLDPVTIEADGKIKLVTGTKRGAPQAGNFDPYRLTNAATIAVMAGIETVEYRNEEERSAVKVTGISSGSWIAVKGADFGTDGASKFYCKIKPPAAEGNRFMQIRAGGRTGVPVCYIKIEPGKTEYTENILIENGITGIQDIVFIFYGQTGWDFEDWKFIK